MSIKPSELSDEEFEKRVAQRRIDRMRRIDSMPAELRELVHAYGLRVVDTCVALGVEKPRHIKHLVEAVLDEFSPTRGSHSSQGTRAHVDGPRS